MMLSCLRPYFLERLFIRLRHFTFDFVIWVIALGGVAVPGFAHDPFDGGTRMLVHDTTIEVEVTMGSDAAREFLKGAGVPAREIATMTRANESRAGIELPLALASHLFELRSGQKEVAATGCLGVPGEAESVFIATYPRPPTTILEARAAYFSGIQYMKTGPFVAADDQARVLATALLSPTSPVVSVPLAGAGDALPEAEKAHAPRPRFDEFLRLGVVHILTGFDHLLFLCALLVGVRTIKPMLVVITCFTLGHSITLALAALELVNISSRIIEPLIAASIAVVGVENFLRPAVTADRYWMAGGFGLIHGFGFAGALRETGLGNSAGSIVMPLFSFNLGVEAGQLLVASLVVPLLLLLRKKDTFARYSVPAISLVVILISGYWFLDRTVFSR